jgi:threonine dehydratase
LVPYAVLLGPNPPGTGGLAPNDSVTSDATGQGVTATAGQKANGVCLSAASAGQDAIVLLRPHTA